MLEKLIEQCPEDIWNIKAGGFVFCNSILREKGDTNSEDYRCEVWMPILKK